MDAATSGQDLFGFRLISFGFGRFVLDLDLSYCHCNSFYMSTVFFAWIWIFVWDFLPVLIKCFELNLFEF